MGVIKRLAAPRTDRGKRAVANRESLTIENTKKCLFIKGSQQAAEVVIAALSDLTTLKKPHSITYFKKNQELVPFESMEKLETIMKKNDASMFMYGSNQKKRPNNIILGRTFDGQLLDMIELGIVGIKQLNEFKAEKPAYGIKPVMVFSSPLFDSSPPHQLFKSLFSDLYRGAPSFEKLNLAGLSYVMSATICPDNEKIIYIRSYAIHLKKSGTYVPRVELVEMGPRLNFEIRRTKEASVDTWKKAMKIPKEISGKDKKTKNISSDEMDNTLARVHMGRQGIDKLQTRKQKGLRKSKFEVSTIDSDENNDDTNANEDVDMSE